MNKAEERMLDAFSHALQKTKVDWTEELSDAEWSELFKEAQKHGILPMVYDAVHGSSSAQSVLREGRLSPVALYKKNVQMQVYVQAVKTAGFLHLYSRFTDAGLHPLIMKGLVCRELYPNPDLRPSTDEDLLIAGEDFRKYHDILIDAGLRLAEPGKNPDEEFEVSYINENKYLYIEIHKSLFPPDSEAYGDLNRFFTERVYDRRISGSYYGTEVYTLEYTDHLFYLITHAWKHFLHCGFGIRQIGDIIVFSDAYEKKINWECLKEKLDGMKGIRFAQALYRIGEKYLIPGLSCYCIVDGWSDIPVDEEPLLADLLTGGIYGASSMNRLHSSNITLKAVENGKKSHGRSSKSNGKIRSAFSAVFLPLNSMKGKYRYLEKYPFLLPAAWVQRVYGYLTKENAKGRKDNNAQETLKVGQERVELLKYYDMI